MKTRSYLRAAILLLSCVLGPGAKGATAGGATIGEATAGDATTNGANEAAASPMAAKLQEGPEADILARFRESGVAREDFALEARFDFFPAPGLGTFVIVVFEVGTETLAYAVPVTPVGEALAGGDTPAGEVANLRAFGMFSPVGDPELITRHFGAPFMVRRGEGDGAFSATRSLGFALPPGEYVLHWGAVDVASGTAATRRQAVTVPDFTAGELRLTSVLVCTGYEPQSEPFEAGRVYEGVRMANLVFQDDIDRLFSPSATIELIYAVTGAQPNATTHRFELEVSYRILGAADGQSIARFPSQVLDNPSIGQPLPLAGIEGLEPGGEYVLEIVVRDLVSGSELTETLPFALAEAGDGDDA